MEHSKPDPSNQPNGAPRRADKPTHANSMPEDGERWLRSVVENSWEVVKVIEPDGTLRYASPALGRMLGYDPEEAVGKMNVFDNVHPDDLPHVLKETEKALLDEGVVSNVVEYRFRHKDGSWRHVQSVGTYLLDDPYVRGVLVTVRDVTERKEAEDRFRAQYKNLPVPTYTWQRVEEDFMLVDYNDAARRYTGDYIEDLLGSRASEMLSERPVLLEMIRRCFEGRTTLRREMPWQMLGTGEERRFVATCVFVPPDLVMIHTEDVTERAKAEQRLHFQAQLLGAVGEAVVAVDLEGRVVYWNRAAEKAYGWSEEEVMGRNLREMVIPEDLRDRAEEIMTEVREGRGWSGEFTVRRRDGTPFPVIATNTAVFGENGGLVGVISVFRDVAERKALEERLAHQAFHDPLTDLPNRHLFVNRLAHALERTRRTKGRKVAVLFMDLDKFKVLNDSLGHGLGDRVLKAVSERLRECLRPEDTLARFGGDEFVVLLEEVGEADEAVRVAERINEEFREPLSIGGRELFVRVSIGVALGDVRAISPEDLLRDADTAMYRAKYEGVGHSLFEPSMHRRALGRLELENDLRRAIERGEFVVHYQPIISLETGEVWGLEALVRWDHPERGFLEPDEFVPVAEDSGLVVPIGEIVLGEACRRAVEWQRKFPRTPPLAISVNLSGRQLRRPAFHEVLERVLKESGLSPSSLGLDITETVYISALDADTGTLDRMKATGIRISIDDFGTGYSSLSYLKRIPADILKVDKSFVRGLGVEVEDTAITQTVVDLAHVLGMEVVAEGVEIEEQETLLREMGCDFAQGYLFSKPLPPEEVPRFLAG